MLEDDCRLATSVDDGFVEKINKQFAKNSHYKKSKSKDPVFTILHYAGQVKIFLRNNKNFNDFDLIFKVGFIFTKIHLQIPFSKLKHTWQGWFLGGPLSNCF